MIIESIQIAKFRGFENVGFELGKNITVIAGQNGTQKTTVLGMLSQPFTITDKNHPIHGEKPLSGGSYRSSFSEKFKLSSQFDLPKLHEWTLSLNDITTPEYTTESIKRSDSEIVRFWKKGDRGKGSGYLQYPVIYLSLRRLFPIGEDAGIDASTNLQLSQSEIDFYKKWHDDILIITNEEGTEVSYLESKEKNTLGINTAVYDWRMISAGQDNIGKILLAVLSFKRLKEKYKKNYEGGILVIDEIDATLYPASQLRLLNALRSFSSKYDIQIVFTTHSLTILEEAFTLQQDEKLVNQIKVVFLQKQDGKVYLLESRTFEEIRHKLHVTIAATQKKVKITTFVEDNEAMLITKALLKAKRGNGLIFIDANFSSSHLIELARKKVPGFRTFESLIILDGDVRENKSERQKIVGNKLNNIILLPGGKSPESLLATYLNNLSEKSNNWDEIHTGYTKQFVFKDFKYNDIVAKRDVAKNWFQQQQEYWGRNCSKLVNLWIKDNKSEVDAFLIQFDEAIKSIKL
jgi:ABC-type multidrug transport system ATPase subunit